MVTHVNNASCRTEVKRKATAMSYCNAEFLQQIGIIQQKIHERERRRHELEEQQFAYFRSDERLTKMKRAKMLCYYKELHERERQAKMRNLVLLGNVESLAGKLKEFSIDCSRLLQKRLEYKKHITRLKKDGRNIKCRGESEACESVVDFASHLTSSGSSVEDGIIATLSPARTELVPNHPSHSTQQSALLMHRHVSNSRDAAVSDDILNSGVCLEGAHVSDMHDQQMESDSAISQRKGDLWRREDLDSKEAEVSSRSVTLKRPAAVVSLERCPTRSPSPVTTDPRDSSQYRDSRGEDEELFAEEDSGNRELPDHSKSRHPGIPSPAVESRLEPSAHKQSDISVLTNQRSHTSRRDDKTQGQNKIHIQEEPLTHQSGRPDALGPPNRLCTGGFCHLLDSMERRLHAKDMNIYQHCTVNEQKLGDIISMCRQRGSLDDVDLQTCGAVILKQLPLLCYGLPQRCLLPADLIGTHRSPDIKPDHIRSCLSAEGALLWDRCFRHMLHLQYQNVLSTDLIVRIFTPLLVLNNATYTDKAGELLKRLLTYESDPHQPSESQRSSSCSLSSLLDDSMEIKPARPSERYSPVAGTQEIQSAEEDRADQSPVESIPIRDTKAYQLLKQTVAQERCCSDTEEEDSKSSANPCSDVRENIQANNLSHVFLDINKRERAEALWDSTTQNSRKSIKTKVNAFSAVQSKAFWGESDDSEIEMALRPQSRNDDANDSDDFYD